MTTIACNNKEMSGDRQFVYAGNVKYTGTTKIHQFDNDFAQVFEASRIAVGFCGNVGCFPDALDYMREGGKIPKLSNMEMLLLTDTGNIYWGSTFKDWVQIEKPFWAIGSGMGFALPVLETGGSPQEAVEMAMKFDINTGAGVTTISFA